MGPKGIIWIITGMCNLRCKHCYSTTYEGEKELDTNEAFRLLKDAANSGVEFVNITGGEPLLRKDIFTILEEGKNLGMHMSVFSNLTLLKEENADLLYRLEVPVYTSMDGPNRIVHERIRGANSWAPFLRGLKLLIDRDVDVHVNVAVSSENWSEVPKTVEKAYEFGASSVSVIPVMKAGRATETGVYISRNEFKWVLKAIAEKGVKAAVWCAPFAGLLDSSYLAYSCKGWSVMDISPSGRFIMCDVINYEIANVLKTGIKGAWEEMYKNNVYLKFVKTPKECLSCPISNICRGGCYARTWPHLKKDPLCPR